MHKKFQDMLLEDEKTVFVYLFVQKAEFFSTSKCVALCIMGGLWKYSSECTKIEKIFVINFLLDNVAILWGICYNEYDEVFAVYWRIIIIYPTAEKEKKVSQLVPVRTKDNIFSNRDTKERQ